MVIPLKIPINDIQSLTTKECTYLIDFYWELYIFVISIFLYNWIKTHKRYEMSRSYFGDL